MIPHLRLLLLLLLLTSPALGQHPDTLCRKIAEHFKGGAYPAVLIGYADGYMSFSQAFGLADSASQKPLQPDDLMMSGSTGKIIVSAAVLKLVSQNRLELDAPISRYLKGEWAQLTPNYNCLTVRQLLQHRTGLARYIFTDFKEDVKLNPDKVWTPQERIRYVSAAKPLFSCGSAFAYSDTNYILLGAIIEEVTKQPFYTYAEKEILAPLQLHSFTPTTQRSIEGLANGYAGTKDPLGFTGETLDASGKSRYNMQFEWTGGGYAYNPEDMAKLMLAIFNGKVFGKELLADYTATLPAPEVGAEYGLGIMKYTLNGKTLYGHSGFFPGYIAQVYYDPEKRAAYVFQINTTQPNGTQDMYGRIKSFFQEAI
ncbi:MAG: beta-lactamase family protein [Hymenobacteraceae bacterium]|nr:beta-lactamase family protein [Hymenobacteraceae bacterium]